MPLSRRPLCCGMLSPLWSHVRRCQVPPLQLLAAQVAVPCARAHTHSHAQLHTSRPTRAHALAHARTGGGGVAAARLFGGRARRDQRAVATAGMRCNTCASGRRLGCQGRSGRSISWCNKHGCNEATVGERSRRVASSGAAATCFPWGAATCFPGERSQRFRASAVSGRGAIVIRASAACT
jgi:hypothetical protein